MTRFGPGAATIAALVLLLGLLGLLRFTTM